jgi:CHAT domain-containing protein/tetratricopeptide (TPR) repeat protein
MRIAYNFSLLICILILIINCKRTDKQDESQIEVKKISQQNFENKLIDALEASDTTKVVELIKNNRYKFGPLLKQLYISFLKNKIKDENEEAIKNLSRARWLSSLYQNLFEDDYYQQRVLLFQNWTNEQKQEKLDADSLNEQAARFFEAKNYESADTLNQDALRIYQDLNDLENEAYTFNSLGFNNLRMKNFELADIYFKSSLNINRQLGLKPAIMINYDNLGELYNAKQNFSEALNYFQKALDMAEEIGDENFTGKQWMKLGYTYRKLENHKEAYDCLQKAFQIAQSMNDLNLQATTLLNLGAVYNDQSQFEKAVEAWEEALEIARKIKERSKEGILLSNLSVAYRSLGRYDESIKTLKEAIKLNRETGNRWTEGNSLRELGVNLYLKGKPDSAIFYWQQSLKIFKDIPDTTMIGHLNGIIGIYYKNIGQPYEALSYYNQALKLVRIAKNEREEANILCNIANVYTDLLAEYAKAEEIYKEALEIKLRLGQLHFAGAITANLATCHKYRGNYQEAIEHYFEALKIAKETHYRSGEATYLSNIGSIYMEVGNYQEATSYYRNALIIFQEIGEIKPEVEVLMNLGTNYFNHNKVDSAFVNYKKALDLAKKIGHKEFESEMYYYIGEAYIKQGENYKALEYYQKAFKMIEETKDLRAEGKCFTALGDVYYKLQNYTKALTNYQNGLDIGQKIGSPEGIWKAYYGLGKVSENIGNDEDAEKNYKYAIETIEGIRAKLQAKSLKGTFLENKIDVYYAMINLLLKMGHDEEAHQYYERSKARSFLDILSTGRINITEGISPERLKRKNELELELNTVQQDLVNEYSKSETEQNKKQIASLEGRLKKARQQYDELLQEIELNHPRYATLTGATEPLSLKQIQQKVIQPGTFFIEYLVGENQTITWVIGKNSFVYEKLDLKREDLEKMVTDLLQPFRDVKEGKIKNLANVGFDPKLAQQLYLQIFQPVEKHLQKDSHLIIVPDGILHYLPFEALVTEIEKKQFDRNIIFSRYENAQYLVERYAISYSPSASVLNPELLKQDKSTKGRGKLLAFGNPDFGRAREELKMVKDEKEEDISNYYALVSRSSRGGIFDQLPKSEEEVKAIAGILKPSLLYIGKDAKEETFKEKSDDFANIHLATHCILEETQPMYSRIVFAQDDDPTEDGFLHTYEVFNLKLNADLVTLGACETGLGKLSRGEGLIGLTRAFMYAGTPSVVVSLWSVDESTAELMTYFYQNLKAGMRKMEALRQAKIKLLSSRGKFATEQEFSFAQPYLWAPFVLIGKSK